MCPIPILLLVVKWQFSRSLRKNLTQPPTQAWFEFADAGFLSAGRAGSSLHVPWTLVQRVIETRDGLLIGTGNDTYYWLPERVFASRVDFENLIGLIATKVTRFDRLTK
jgi:hypothetical protein